MYAVQPAKKWAVGALYWLCDDVSARIMCQPWRWRPEGRSEIARFRADVAHDLPLRQLRQQVEVGVRLHPLQRVQI